MKNHQPWLEKFLPSLSIDEKGGDFTRGYTSFSRGMSIILMVLVLVPLTFISVLSHYQYKQLLQAEELDQLVLNLEEAQNTTEAFISELQSIIKFVARDDRYEELLNPTELEALFVRLQKEYPGFADIEIIDAQGYQKAYFGPYRLKEQNYTEQSWYKEVLLHGVHISKIFSGFRNIPHFVVAVSRTHPQQEEQWVLRVTIDGKTLQNFINTIRTNYADDMFLIDSLGITQTQPHKFGQLGEECILCGDEGTKESTLKQKILRKDTTTGQLSEMIISKKTFKGQQMNHASVDLQNTPWKLVLIKEQYLHANSWVRFKIKLTTMFFSCVIIAVFIILEISTALTNHIRESDRKHQQLYSEAESNEKLASIGRLAAGVAHEINNPLSIINQKTGLVQDFMEMSDDFVHKEAMDEALNGVQKSVERCKTITHRLLGFARQTDVETEEIDINKTIREVIDFLAKEATYNQIQIVFDLADNLTRIVSDRGPLQQVFLNITNNAIDAIGSHGKIILSSKPIDEETIQINIADDGPGMSPEVLSHIFEPFFTTKVTGKGTGLGLSITYGLVKKLGGNINVVSEIGSGTTFEITLPVKQNDVVSS